MAKGECGVPVGQARRQVTARAGGLASERTLQCRGGAAAEADGGVRDAQLICRRRRRHPPTDSFIASAAADGDGRFVCSCLFCC